MAIIFPALAIEGTNLSVDILEFDEKFVCSIYVDSVFWDYKTFDTLEDAKAFRLDPLAEDRARAIRIAKHEAAKEAAMIPYRAMTFTKISRGRRVGPKPPAS